MDIKLMKTETNFEAALREIERLMDAKLDTPEGDQLDVLTTLVEAWEQKHHQIDPAACGCCSHSLLKGLVRIRPEFLLPCIDNNRINFRIHNRI